MITGERIDAIFDEMNKYVLELASEPSALGPQYFQDIIAKCRGYLNNVSLVVSELNREKLFESSELRKLEAVYGLDYDNLLANDESVKRLASIEDRKSTVGFLLRDKRGEINEAKDRLHALEAVYKVVIHRSRELHATMNAIKDQRRLMVTELSTGAFYGDERTPRRRSNPSDASPMEDISTEELAALMAGSSEDPPDTTEPATPVESEGTAEEVLSEADPISVAVSPAVEPDPMPASNSPVEALTEAQPVATHGPITATEAEVLDFLNAKEEVQAQEIVSAPALPTSDEEDFMSILNSI